jgi:hypothetical protein
MSRKTNTVEWFPHYANASTKFTLTTLEKKYKASGYAAWFKLLECLAQAEGHYVPCQNEIHKDYLSTKLGLDYDQLTNMLQLLADISAIDTELWNTCKVVWSGNFIQGIKEVYANRGRDLPSKPLIKDLLSTNSSQVSTNLVPTYLREEEKELEEGIRGREEKELEDSLDPRFEIFNYWNSKKIIVHEKMTDKMRTKIQSALKGCSAESIKKAIDNYDKVIKNPELYFFHYKWALEDFMGRGLNKFMDIAEPLENFLKNKAKQNNRQPLKSSEDIAKENEEFQHRGDDKNDQTI